MILSLAQAAGFIALREYMEAVGLQTITVSVLNHGRVRPIHGMSILFAPKNVDLPCFGHYNLWRSDMFYRVDQGYHNLHGRWFPLWGNPKNKYFDAIPGLHHGQVPQGTTKAAIVDVSVIPLLIKLDESSLVTHGGIDLENPWNPNLSANVYGRWDPNKKVSRDIDSEECWWNLYSHKTLVYYGHVVADTIRYRNGLLEHTNSVGLDTGAVHGGHLSAICHETKQTTVIKSKNYYAEVKGKKIEPSRSVVEFKNRIAAITKTNQTIEAVPQMLEVERL